MATRLTGFVIFFALIIPSSANAQTSQCAASRNDIRFVSYLLSKPQDAAQCALTVEGGQLKIGAPTSNPSMTCPDMFAWKLFAEVVRDKFWLTWAADQETWPGVSCPNGDPNCKDVSPLPMCTPGMDVKSCCTPAAANNPGYDDPVYHAKFCPYFPGDHTSSTQPSTRTLFGAVPSKAHAMSFSEAPAVRARLLEETQLMAATPGRKIRQSMSELVFRNKPMFDYVFSHNIFTQEGLIEAFRRNAKNIGTRRDTGAPYHLKTDQNLSEIDLPSNAIMIKSNWLNKRRATEMGLHEDPAHPFVKINITTPVTDNNGTILEPGEHWLIALHISSKDIPNWVWASFEHVNNPGRCDYTGCNDSYGYVSADAMQPGQARNFTRPHTKCDALPLAAWVFQEGDPYDGGQIAPELASIFSALSIGTTDNNSLVPAPTDKAWLSYRLKGAQVNFTDSMGRPALLGNSVTEAGFMTTSSCMTCHARAAIGATGTVPPPLGVFLTELTDSGYMPSARGAPNPDWYNSSGQPPALMALQTDFVWGFLAANCVTKDCQPASPGTPALMSLHQGLRPNQFGTSLRERAEGKEQQPADR